MNSARLTLLGLAAVAWIASAGAQTILVNGDFESQPNFGINGDGGYTRLTGSDIPGWTIVANHAVTVHNPNTYPFITGSYSVNTDGEGFNSHNADFYQDFSTTNGATYQLTFDWQGWTNNSPSTQLEVLVFNTKTSATLFDGLYSFSASLSHETATFAGSGDTYRLEIRESPESTFNDNQFVVDNFVVSAIPEPSALALVGGCAALGFAGWRRRRRALS